MQNNKQQNMAIWQYGNMAICQYAEFTHTPFPYAEYADKYAEYAKQKARYAQQYARKYDIILTFQYGNMAI